MSQVGITLLSRSGLLSLPEPERGDLIRRHRVHGHALTAPPSRARTVRLAADADVLAATNACLPTLDDRLLQRLPRLRSVVLYATGHDHVDPGALARAGVELTVLPDYATVAVAEHGLALLMTLATRLHLAHDRSRGLAPGDVSLRGGELAGRVLGVVGLGRIGSHLARIGAGIGMRVIGTDPDPGAAPGVSRTSLPELLRRSDAVALCPSRAFGDPALVGAAELALMKPGAWLVNPTRAALVDTPAAVAAVRAGRLRGYAVDDTVLGPQEADLVAEGRVVQTGHSAWWRDEVLERGGRLWAEAVLDAAERLAGAARHEVSA